MCENVSLNGIENFPVNQLPNIVWQRVPRFDWCEAETSGTSDQHSFLLSQRSLTTCRWPQGPGGNSVLDQFRQVRWQFCLADLDHHHGDLEWYPSPNRKPIYLGDNWYNVVATIGRHTSNQTCQCVKDSLKFVNARSWHSGTPQTDPKRLEQWPSWRGQSIRNHWIFLAESRMVSTVRRL